MKKKREKKETNSVQNIPVLGWYLYIYLYYISPASPNLAMRDHATNYHVAFHHAYVRTLHL